MKSYTRFTYRISSENLEEIFKGFEEKVLKYYRIKNWDEFQSQAKRHWPWVKLHKSFVSCSDYINASNEERLLMVICLLIGHEQTGIRRGSVPDDAKFIQHYGRFRRRPKMVKLIESGFLLPSIEIDVDQMSTSCRPNVDPTRGEERKKTGGVDSITPKKYDLPPKKFPFKGGKNYIENIKNESISQAQRAAEKREELI